MEGSTLQSAPKAHEREQAWSQAARMLGWYELSSTAEIWKIVHIPEKTGITCHLALPSFSHYPLCPVTTLHNISSQYIGAAHWHDSFLKGGQLKLGNFSYRQRHFGKRDAFSLQVFLEFVLVNPMTATATTISCVKSTRSSRGDIWNVKSPEKIPTEDKGHAHVDMSKGQQGD